MEYRPPLPLGSRTAHEDHGRLISSHPGSSRENLRPGSSVRLSAAAFSMRLASKSFVSTISRAL